MSDFHTPGAQPPGSPQPGVKRGLHGCVWAIIIVVGLIVLIAVINAVVGGGTNSGNSSVPATSGTAATASSNAAADGSSWTYTSEKDAVRNSTVNYAMITSDNTVQFDFPYNGGSTLRMTIRHDHRGDNVILDISKGQFVCSVSSCSGEMNIDGVTRHLTLDEAADGSANTLFARGESGIIKSLKSAKKIIVELPFYQAGNKQFTFTTAKGLVWPPVQARNQAAK